MRAIAEEIETSAEDNETVAQECDETEREASDDDGRTIDALLATSYSLTSPQMLTDDTTSTGEVTYGTCIDAFSATVDLDELHSPIVTGKSSKSKTGEFDMSLPLPSDIKGAMESPNWDVPMGYKYAVERECNAWIKQKVLQGTSWDQIKQDLHALNMRTLFTVKTDKKNRFQRAKLRIIILGHQHCLNRASTILRTLARLYGGQTFGLFAHSPALMALPTPNKLTQVQRSCLKRMNWGRKSWLMYRESSVIYSDVASSHFA